MRLGYKGPSPDEGLSITSGLRTLDGHGISDGYSSWLEGFLLWPTPAALGYQAAGLLGSRYVALLLAAIALLAVAFGTSDLFGPKAGFWAAVSLSVSGSFLTLARLAVFDALALSALSFSAVPRPSRSSSPARAVRGGLPTYREYPSRGGRRQCRIPLECHVAKRLR